MKRFLPYIALTLFVLQLLTMLVSWLLSAAFPDSGIRTLLSGEGLRWFFGHFTQLLATPCLVWLLLLSMAYGVLVRCGVLRLGKSYREGRARLMTLLLLVVYVGVITLMAAVPHAILLSATGSLWASPFSQALVPFIAFGVIALGAFYGIIAGDTLTEIMEVFRHARERNRAVPTRKMDNVRVLLSGDFIDSFFVITVLGISF